jgi:hypothetical protein
MYRAHQRRPVREAQPDLGGACRKPVEVLVKAKDPAAVRAHGLEQALPVEETAVQRRYCGLLRLE